MRVNVVNKIMEITSLADCSNDSFSFEQNAKFNTYLNNSKIKLNSNNKSQNNLHHKHLNHLKGLDSYEPTNKNLSEELVEHDFNNFIYENYIIELIYPNHTSFREIYNALEVTSLITLPNLIEDIVNELIRIADKRKIFIDEDKMYDLLFSRHKMGLAMEFFKNNIVDLAISDEKIIRIYEKIEIDGNYNYDVAVKEIDKFVNFVELLSA